MIPNAVKEEDLRHDLLQSNVSDDKHGTDSIIIDTFEGEGTFFSTIFTLSNSCIGAGILSLPFAYKNAGIATALGLTLVYVAIMAFTLHILIFCTEAVRQKDPSVRNYQGIAGHLFGSKGEVAVEITICVFLFGACVGILVIIGDMSEPIVNKVCGHMEGGRQIATVSSSSLR